MLDQNTDRMWYVIGAVIVGAAIIFIINTAFPQVFASVGDMFGGAVGSVEEVIKDIPLETEEARMAPWLATDFTYAGDTITGFTEAGVRRLVEDHPDVLTLPLTNPNTNESLINVSKEAFRQLDLNGNQLGVEYRGLLDLGNVEDIEEFAFYTFRFTGDVDLSKVRSIGWHAFTLSTFTGEFIVPNLEHVKSYGLKNSLFTGSFDAPKLVEVGDQSFEAARFSGDFNAPLIERIGYNCFKTSPFDGEFNAPVVEYISSYAFIRAAFTNGSFGGSN